MERDGDFVIGESTAQHQNDLLMSEEGAYKQAPTIGVGLLGYLEDDGPENLMRKIRHEFHGDGMNIEKLVMDEVGKLNIEAEYT